jgi:hypothetical protein
MMNKDKKMGYMGGGMSAKKKPDMMGMGMSKGGMSKKKMGYNKGGMVACGASNPAAKPVKMSK